MCEFEHTCFISYRHHPSSRLAVRFIENLCAALRDELALIAEQDIFIDQERMNGGSIFEDALADALCKSVCMIAVFTPQYFSREKPYCAREYHGMELIEEARLNAIGKVPAGTGLIIPVVLRGENRLPRKISDSRIYHSFNDFSMSSEELAKDRSFNSLVRRIAESVDECLATQRAASADLMDICNGFELPPVERMSDWFDEVDVPRQSYPRLGGRL